MNYILFHCNTQHLHPQLPWQIPGNSGNQFIGIYPKSKPYLQGLEDVIRNYCIYSPSTELSSSGALFSSKTVPSCVPGNKEVAEAVVVLHLFIQGVNANYFRNRGWNSYCNLEITFSYSNCHYWCGTRLFLGRYSIHIESPPFIKVQIQTKSCLVNLWDFLGLLTEVDEGLLPGAEVTQGTWIILVGVWMLQRLRRMKTVEVLYMGLNHQVVNYRPFFLYSDNNKIMLHSAYVLSTCTKLNLKVMGWFIWEKKFQGRNI